MGLLKSVKTKRVPKKKGPVIFKVERRKQGDLALRGEWVYSIYSNYTWESAQAAADTVLATGRGLTAKNCKDNWGSFSDQTLRYPSLVITFLDEPEVNAAGEVSL
jgi:hypothetical protein